MTKQEILKAAEIFAKIKKINNRVDALEKMAKRLAESGEKVIVSIETEKPKRGYGSPDCGGIVSSFYERALALAGGDCDEDNEGWKKSQGKQAEQIGFSDLVSDISGLTVIGALIGLYKDQRKALTASLKEIGITH